MAENLGVKAVAEGIEDEAQLANLRAHGCEFGQGFFFAASYTADEFIARANVAAKANAR